MTSALFQSIGVTELLIVLGVVVLIFGPKRLPSLGRQLGSGMREFKDSITKRSKDDDEGLADGRESGRADAQAALGRPAVTDSVATADPAAGEAAREAKS